MSTKEAIINELDILCEYELNAVYDFIEFKKYQTAHKTKTHTQILIEKMERGEYVSDDEYLGSISGFMEELDRI